MEITVTTAKKDLVKEVFENPRRYFGGRQYDVRIRAETVKSLAQGLHYQRALDIGCGDGSISLPLIGPGKRLTLIDVSENMLSLVRSKIPPELAGSVEVRNEDFMTAPFCPESFDLVVCLGLMAHVDSPGDFVEKIASLMKPGASLILEFTDAFDLAGRLSRFFGSLRKLVAPPRYPVNLLSYGVVSRLANRHGFRSVSQFRYGLPPLPGMEFLSHTLRYNMIRRINGTCDNRRNTWWGNEYICLLTLDRPPAQNSGDGPVHGDS
jgi:SAM-dependent methyltransferase